MNGYFNHLARRGFLLVVAAVGWSATSTGHPAATSGNPTPAGPSNPALILRGQWPGARIWDLATGGPIESSPALDQDGGVYVGSNDRKVYAVDSRTGRERWQFLLPAAVKASPVLGVEGTLVAQSEDGTVVALDRNTGARRWSVAIEPEWMTVGSASPAVGSDGTVYCPGLKSRLHALDGRTGARIGTATLEQEASVAYWYSQLESPVIGASGWIYTGAPWIITPHAGGVTFWAYDPAAGTVRWSLRNNPYAAIPASSGVGGEMYLWPQAVDAATGAPRGAFQGYRTSQPAIGPDGLVYLGVSLDNRARDVLAAFDPVSRAKVWEFSPGAPVASSPAVASDSTVVFGCDNHHVYGLDGRTGTNRWEFTTGGPVRSSPALGPDGTVYLGSNDGRLYALRGTAPLASSPWPKFRHDAGNSGNVVPLAEGPPRIGQSLQSRRVAHQGSFTLDLTATGSLPLAYRWYHDLTPDPGAQVSLGPDDALYAVVHGRLFALDGATGATRWRASGRNPDGATPTLAADGTLFLVTSSFSATLPRRATRWCSRTPRRFFTTCVAPTAGARLSPAGPPRRGTSPSR